MQFKIELTKVALKNFKSLSEKNTLVIFAAIEDLKQDPFNKNLDIKKLKTPFEGYRIRKGSFRILFIIENKTILIYSIKHRKDAYK